jgi:hypothetical protein
MPISFEPFTSHTKANKGLNQHGNKLHQHAHDKYLLHKDTIYMHSCSLCIIYSQASLLSKLVKQMVKAWNAESGYR